MDGSIIGGCLWLYQMNVFKVYLNSIHFKRVYLAKEIAFDDRCLNCDVTLNSNLNDLKTLHLTSNDTFVVFKNTVNWIIPTYLYHLFRATTCLLLKRHSVMSYNC